MVAPSGRIVTVPTGRNQVDRIQYTAAGAGPAAGTVINFHPQATFGDIAVGALTPVMDFGTWTPPYAGDFLVTLKPLSAVK